ncbi:MAG TPA: NAD(P)-dependent oxidoreductase [Desulfobacterales bacterium]|nr:NAD(P)-dependent oxidoreductase [Desulfobacterales bacterium]
MSSTPKVYLASPVFREIADNPRVSVKYKFLINKVWSNLNTAAEVIVADSRFPSAEEIKQAVSQKEADFIGCHIGHSIGEEIVSIPSVKAVSTSNVGWNHIHLHPGVIVTNTPGVLAGTIADYTVSLILANLRNITGLNQYVWNGQWKPGEKWDLDRHITKNTENLTYGILGIGEIGREVVHRVAPWGIHIAYHDIFQSAEMEEKYPNLNYYEDVEQLFKIADILSIHIPLDDSTRHFVGERLLRLMRPRALLVNPARGGIIDFEALIRLLKSKEIAIHLAFDVYEEEPISAEMLDRFRQINAERPDLRFIFTPHSATADADTRARMSATMLSNLNSLVRSTSVKDIKELNLIPPLAFVKKEPRMLDDYRIFRWWQGK